MINKRFTITAELLNSEVPQVLDVMIEKETTAVTGNSETRYLYPKEVQIINDTVGDVEWLSLRDEIEYQAYVDSPSSFTFVRLPNSYILEDDSTKLGKCYKMVIKGVGTDAMYPLYVEFINYVNSSLS